MTDYKGRIIPNGTFDVETLYKELEGNTATGAFTSFIGVVRDISDKTEKKVESHFGEIIRPKPFNTWNEYSEFLYGVGISTCDI